MRVRLALVATLAALAACSSGGGSTGQAPPAKVDALPKPSLPSWISSVSPTKTAQTLSQIRVIFASPVASVGALEGDGPRAVLDHFALTPDLPGRFVLLTPRMVGFVPTQALPIGMRVRVTLSSGLRDLAGDALASDLSWTFETAGLAFTDLSTGTPAPDAPSPQPTGLTPTLTLSANAAVDIASLTANAALEGGGETVPLAVKLEKQATPAPDSAAAAAFDPSLDVYTYDFTPQRPLKKATTYRWKIAPGVFPAAGNLPTSGQYLGVLRTYAPLAVAAASPSPYGARFAGGDPSVAFTNPIDPASLAGNIALSPAPKDAKGLFKVSDDSPNVIAVDPYQLDPGTSYAILLGAGLRDTFGQELGAAQKVAVTTANFAPGFWAPGDVNVFPSGGKVALDLYATNVPGNRYRATYVKLAPPAAPYFDYSYGGLGEAKTWPVQTIAGAKTNAQSIIAVPLDRKLGGPAGTLAYGVSADLGGDTPTTVTGLVQLTNLGIFAQTFPNRASVAVQRLSDGAPVAGAAIALYRSDDNDNATRCAGGTTGADGTLDLTGTALAACYAGSLRADEAPSILAVASAGADWTVAPVRSYAGIFQFDVNGGWSNGQPLSRGTVFSDRQMYQPGESARVTGVAYYARNGAIVPDADAAYAVKLIDPSNGAKSLGSVTTDAFGVFSLALPFSQNQALGYYTVDATGSSGNEISGQLRVAQFKPPNFKLDVALSGTSAVAGGSMTAAATAAYLFGAPLDGGSAKIAVTRDVAYLAPKGLDDYTFGRQWFWPDEQPSFDTDVLQSTGTFDKSGAWSQTVAVPADLPFPMTYSVDVTASDVSNASVDTTQTFTALASDAVIGLQAPLVSKAGDPMTVKLVASDLAGKLQSGRAIHVVLQKMTYGSATQLQAGGEAAQNSVQYTTVEETDATSGDAAVDVALHPKDAGPYRVRANFAGAKSDASATDLQAFVIGAGEVDWGAQDTSIVNVKLDKKTYKVGDTATALVATPYAKSDVYFAVIRNDVITKTLIHATGNGPEVSFKVTPAMLPNAAVEALVVRRGAPLQTVKPGALDSLARVGVAAFRVDLADRYLKVGISPGIPRIEPGAHQTLALTVRDMAGKPAPGEAIVMVVDESILQLTGYRPPDLVQTVFADQPISVRFADSRQHVVLQTRTPGVEKGWGYGGGFLAGAGSTRVRTNFQPLAYYRIVHTDANGTATVGFDLPDDLTTWRAMVVAIGKDDRHFGTDDATFVATKPLLTNPLLPQFARPGDVIDAGMTALDATGAGGTLSFTAKLVGALAFSTGDPHALSGTQSLGSTLQALRFPLTVGTPAPTTVAFSSKVGNATDAFSVPFSVRDRAVTESAIETGATATTASVPIDPAAGGSMRITLANSAITQFAVPASEAMKADVQPFLDDASSRAIVATATANLAARYHLTPGYDPASSRAAALAAIAKLQRSDGGYAFYPDAAASDPFGSANAATALAFAGAPANANLKAYLAKTLANPARYAWCKDAACTARMRFEMLWALDALGDRRSDFLSDIVAAQRSFDPATQIRLARYLLRVPGWQGRGAAMADGLMESVYRTGRYASANVQTRWAWLGSTVAAQAQMLQLLIERKASAEELDGALGQLAAQACNCGWPTLDAAADAMTAISAYAANEKLVPFDASVSQGGTSLVSRHFGTDASAQTVAVPAASLRKGTLTVRATGGGTVHYVVLYTYPVAPDAAGQLAGLRVVREVRPAGEAGTVASMDLASIRDPFALSAGDVYDIGVRVIVDHPVDGVAIEDPLPAGFEAIDASLQTASTATVARADSWAIENRQIYADRVTGYASHLEPGVYEMHYLVRSVTPGTYRWPGARAYLRAAPEQFGRTASSTLKL
ncbi:MAG TPA: Ig-like domain-containing protein [Candidatus Baltobacteraceae bacterium]